MRIACRPNLFPNAQHPLHQCGCGWKTQWRHSDESIVSIRCFRFPEFYSTRSRHRQAKQLCGNENWTNVLASIWCAPVAQLKLHCEHDVIGTRQDLPLSACKWPLHMQRDAKQAPTEALTFKLNSKSIDRAVRPKPINNNNLNFMSSYFLLNADLTAKNINLFAISR